MTTRYVGSRLLQVPPAVAGILLVGFLLIHLAPGDPVLALAGESGNAEYYAFMTEKFGLDRPLPEQLVRYASNVLRGDLGTSYVQGRPVTTIVTERVPATLLLTATALAISTVAGIALGVFGAHKPRGFRDLAVSSATLGIDAVPVFWLGQLLLLAFALRFPLFPVQGMGSAVGTTGFGAGAVDLLRHLALPALVLAASEIAAVARITRAGLLEQMAQGYTRMAAAKGFSRLQVLRRHALRCALAPVVTVIGARVGHLVAGAVVVEVVFGWPGLGRLLLTAMQSRDSPILLALFLLVAFSVVLANLVTDLAYGWLDPRVRLR